jgi:hypothetical protein
VRRDDAAHGLVLHVLELRQQHRLRLSHHLDSLEGPARAGPSSFQRVPGGWLASE